MSIPPSDEFSLNPASNDPTLISYYHDLHEVAAHISKCLDGLSTDRAKKGSQIAALTENLDKVHHLMNSPLFEKLPKALQHEVHKFHKELHHTISKEKSSSDSSADAHALTQTLASNVKNIALILGVNASGLGSAAPSSLQQGGSYVVTEWKFIESMIDGILNGNIKFSASWGKNLMSMVALMKTIIGGYSPNSGQPSQSALSQVFASMYGFLQGMANAKSLVSMEIAFNSLLNSPNDIIQRLQSCIVQLERNPGSSGSSVPSPSSPSGSGIAPVPSPNTPNYNAYFGAGGTTDTPFPVSTAPSISNLLEDINQLYEQLRKHKHDRIPQIINSINENLNTINTTVNTLPEPAKTQAKSMLKEWKAQVDQIADSTNSTTSLADQCNSILKAIKKAFP